MASPLVQINKNFAYLKIYNAHVQVVHLETFTVLPDFEYDVSFDF